MLVDVIDALEPKKNGRPSMKKESNKQPKQAPIEGSAETRQQKSNVYVWKNEYLKKLYALSSKQEKITKEDKSKGHL